MSSPYDSSGRRRRGILSHWVPLVLTVTVATVGLAAWVWSQRRDEQDREDSGPIHHDLDYENGDYGDNPPYGKAEDEDGVHTRPPQSQAPLFNGGGPVELRPGDSGYGAAEHGAAPPSEGVDSSWSNRMSGALRRAPSPQQLISNTSKTVAAGVAAAGAAVGSALASIREEDKTAYADHEAWSQEVEARKDSNRPAAGSSAPGRDDGKRRKTVAIVVSADTNIDDADEDGFHEHAVIGSVAYPRQNDFSKIKLFILIYAPTLKDTGIDATNNLPPASLSSSFSNIGHDQAQIPGDDAKSPGLGTSTASPAFNAVYSQALALVEKESNVLPFTSFNGHVHILRHLQPEIVYLQESLAGDAGAVVTHLQTWLRYDIILVVGAESGHGGLADSESEAERPGGGAVSKAEKWWQREDRVGRGRGVIVVDSMRVHDDWARRVQGKE